MIRTNYNYPKRVAEQTARIRRIADTLPAGQRNALLNACGNIERHARKNIEYGNAPEPAAESAAVADRYNTNRRILAAMIAGRRVSYQDRNEFGTTEWHSRINEVKTLVAKQYPQYIFCDRWESDGKHPYKTYWLEQR